MAYTPTTWASGDIISTEKLNKIEQGIVEASSSGGSGEIIKFTYDQTTDKYICSHSFSMISTMLSMSDDVPHAVLDNNDNKIELTYNGIIQSSDVYIIFQNCTVYDNELKVTTLQVPSDGDVLYSYDEFVLTPIAVEENA